MIEKTLRIGDCVIVNPGVTDPDTGGDIAGWQGRITGVHTDPEAYIEIQWDSITLKHMPESAIENCERQNLDWSSMALNPHEVTQTKARDSEADVMRIKHGLHRKFGWLALADEGGEIIQTIVNGAASDSERDVFAAWHTYLQETLRFPFEGEVIEPQRGPVRQGDSVKVLGISMLDDSYGTIVSIRHKRGSYDLPLADLEAIDDSLPAFESVRAYTVWFANR